MESNNKMSLATFGAGCFWCVEAVYKELQGVAKVESGYMGGEKENPTYKEVCTGTTGHVEVCQITFDESIVSYVELLEVFWKIHDPTTLNRQGEDIGTQYRSVVFFQDEIQKESATTIKNTLENLKVFENPIVTTIEPASIFYRAENYHQDYFELNGDTNPYCRLVVKPKVEKFRKAFATKLK